VVVDTWWLWQRWLGGSGGNVAWDFCGVLDAAAPAVHESGRHAVVGGSGGMKRSSFGAARERGHCGGG
jgi:hypothetical protein